MAQLSPSDRIYAELNAKMTLEQKHNECWFDFYNYYVTSKHALCAQVTNERTRFPPKACVPSQNTFLWIIKKALESLTRLSTSAKSLPASNSAKATSSRPARPSARSHEHKKLTGGKKKKVWNCGGSELTIWPRIRRNEESRTTDGGCRSGTGFCRGFMF